MKKINKLLTLITGILMLVLGLVPLFIIYVIPFVMGLGDAAVFIALLLGGLILLYIYRKENITKKENIIEGENK